MDTVVLVILVVVLVNHKLAPTASESYDVGREKVPTPTWTAIVHETVLMTRSVLVFEFLFHAFEAFKEGSLSGGNNGECRRELMSTSTDRHSIFPVTTIYTDRAKRLPRRSQPPWKEEPVLKDHHSLRKTQPRL